MLKIRLRRVGRRHDPHFYIVVAEHTAPVKGKYIEKLGYYNPAKEIFSADKDRVQYWLSQGAQMSDTVHNLFVRHKIIKGKPIVKSVKPKKKEKEKGAETKGKEESQTPSADSETEKDEASQEK